MQFESLFTLFVNFLANNGALSEYIANSMYDGCLPESVGEEIPKLKEKIRGMVSTHVVPEHFISGAFIFGHHRGTFDYWYKLSIKWSSTYQSNRGKEDIPSRPLKNSKQYNSIW